MSSTLDSPSVPSSVSRTVSSPFSEQTVEQNFHESELPSLTTPVRTLPSDLPTSLDDRRVAPTFVPGETEFYDAWTGSSTQISAPVSNVAGKRVDGYSNTASSTAEFDLNLDSEPVNGLGLGLGGPGISRYNGEEEDEVQARLVAGHDDLANGLYSHTARTGLGPRRSGTLGSIENGGQANEEDERIAENPDLSELDKRKQLQKVLVDAASDGNVSRVQGLLSGRCRAYIDLNAQDEDGRNPLSYAACFGHENVVTALLNVGVDINAQDRNAWTALMWACINGKRTIAKVLLDRGANAELQSKKGSTAWDLLSSDPDFVEYLADQGYFPASNGADVNGVVGDLGAYAGRDFYTPGGFGDDAFEQEVIAQQQRRRDLMQESAVNLEVDLATLGLDDSPVLVDAYYNPEIESDEEEFIWDRCVGDQMFVFQEDKLDLILDTIITNMTPQRSPAQKPVPANLIFLMSRYAHYHSTPRLLEDLLTRSMDLINDIVERHQWDMTMLAFWVSNATLLSHYLKKDPGLLVSTSRFQLELVELINETFILIIRDAERRTNKILDTAMLDHETIPGLSDVEFQGDWKMFKSKPKPVDDSANKAMRPPSPRSRAQISPRNITSLLSSTLFVLDLYDVHSVITSQILAQLLYWIGAELFNRIITSKKYLSRTKALQIRMNISVIEDWARANNRQPEHYENGSTTLSGESTIDACRKHLAPVIQLLQWLQALTGTGEKHERLIETLAQLPRLTPLQLIQVVKNYRYEVGEPTFERGYIKFLQALLKGTDKLDNHRRPTTPAGSTQPKAADVGKSPANSTDASTQASKPSSDADAHSQPVPQTQSASTTAPPIQQTPQPTTHPPFADSNIQNDYDQNLHTLTLDQSLMLPFSLPTSTDMLITYGAGIGGVNRERARKYIPTVPTEVLGRLNLDGEG